MKLIVGLGNIGKDYENTRHNIGFMALDYYLGSINWKEDKFAYVYSIKDGNETVMFVKPTTFMNLSGNAVRYYANYYKIDIDDILVIQDDLDLPVGKIRIKKNSSAGGHNGIKSIIEQLGTNSFLRVKVGISRANIDTCSYVLGKFNNSDLKLLNDSFNVVNSVIDDFIKGSNVDLLMGRYN